MTGRRIPLVTALLIALVAGLAGMLAGVVLDAPGHVYTRAKYNIRKTLNLPKNWQALPGPAQAEGRVPVECPDPAEALVIITGGQSNAANVNTRLSETPPEDRVAVWFEGECWPAADPILGTPGQGGSLWPPLGAGLSETLQRPVLFINGAVGGTQVSDWLDARSGYRASLLKRVEAARAAGFEPDLVLWHQGETDAGSEWDMDLVETQFRTLADGLLEAMPQARLYLFRASKCIGAHRAQGVEGIRNAQTAVAESRDRIIAGFDTDTLDNEYRWDTCHFNSVGRDAIVARLVPELTGLLD